MNRIGVIFILSVFSISYLYCEVDINYNYHYNKSGPYTKFSDWVPYRLHKWEPKHLEDFYQLYGLTQHYNENELRKDIYFLKIGLRKKFRHPRNALCHIKNEKTYYKYRNLMFMHINLRIMRAYMRLASKYDKRHLYFYNLDFAHELKNSFKIANDFYNAALPYWKESKKYAENADQIVEEIDLGTIETERFEIMNKKLDFERIITDHLLRLDKKRQTVDEFLAKNPGADKPFLDR
ncbi:MAG: hypothetical protein H7A23_05830 [Leptospiraceae bacterium]|nr:hypothetical protein [Leptospiraceae bacterium]MCP5494058.1 hypothetical protein [Leptospiraceae bacterium]